MLLPVLQFCFDVCLLLGSVYYVNQQNLKFANQQRLQGVINMAVDKSVQELKDALDKEIARADAKEKGLETMLAAAQATIDGGTLNPETQAVLQAAIDEANAFDPDAPAAPAP